MRARTIAAASLILLAACGRPGDPGSAMPEGPLARQVSELAVQQGVPRDLVLAIAVVEGGLLLPSLRAVTGSESVPVAGILELRHGRFNSLAAGARLLSVDEVALQADTDLGTVAGVMVLADLGRRMGAQSNDLASWSEAVGELAGFGSPSLRRDYVARVYKTLLRGGLYPARDGELVHIDEHREIPLALTFAPAGLHTMAPDFPGAIWVDTPQTDKWTPGRPDGNASVDTVVVHDTEGGWDASLATLQNDGGKSAHYLVDADGSRVAQFVSESDTAWHAGNWCYNKHSIGIEHVGVASNKSGFAAAEYDKSVELVKSIRERWTVPLDRSHIIGHYQIPNGNLIDECSPPCAEGLDACETKAKSAGGTYGGASNHWDPGYYWMWCQYMEKLGGTCACNDAWSLWNCTTDLTEAWRCNNGNLEKQDCSPCEVQPVGTDDVCHAPGPEPQPEPQPEASIDVAQEPTPANEASVDAIVEHAADSAAADSGKPSIAWQSNDDSGGCSCRSAGPSGSLGLWAVVASMLLACRRSHRRPTPRRRSSAARGTT
ncbi:MAG: N-acetylmuramoyl-L-alanine amidase [Deltaproteobacteria bacterium]|nr:N-acetylmuramoyl-L-alanine amidase [Deltaproteobacteria bacterium]